MKRPLPIHSQILLLPLGLLGMSLDGCHYAQSLHPHARAAAPISPLPVRSASSQTAPTIPMPIVSKSPVSSTSTSSPQISLQGSAAQEAAHIPPGETGGPDPLKTAPAGIRAAIGDGQIALDWNSSGAESYNLYRGDSPHQETVAPLRTQINSTPFVDKGLTNGRTYYYQVTGVVGGKESPRSAELAAIPQAAPPPPVTHLTQAQVLARAAAFCRAVGLSFVPGQARFPVRGSRLPDIRGSAPLPDTYFQPRWDVGDEKTEIEVVDATSLVTKYFTFGSLDPRPAGKAIPRSMALTQAGAIVSATGLTEALGKPEAQEIQMTSPPTRTAHLWSVIFPRQFQGYPVHRQQVTVMLQAESGTLQALGVTFPTPPPAPASPWLTRASAKVIAATSLRRAQGPAFIFDKAQLEWVEPVSQQPIGSREPSGPLRLVWNCGFSEKDRSRAEVWVDAETGQIIGGDIASI